ncbi:Cloroperoxidase [Hymenopellis radicata]|nr:Cloroperoxidase [Hymenopellis radicata]
MSPPHAHERTCPVQEARKHAFCPPQAGDSRSVCPALNAMANHGYIPRNGRNLSIPTLIAGAREVFGLSFVFAAGLVIVTMWSVGRFWTTDLFALGRHGRIEHHASLVHGDTPRREEIRAYKDPSRARRCACGGCSQWRREGSGQGGFCAHADTAGEDVAAVGALHEEIARGEAALLLGVLSSTAGGIPLSLLLSLLKEERLPDDWHPDHTQGVLRTVMASQEIKSIMEDMRRTQASAGDF